MQSIQTSPKKIALSVMAAMVLLGTVSSACADAIKASSARVAATVVDDPDGPDAADFIDEPDEAGEAKPADADKSKLRDPIQIKSELHDVRKSQTAEDVINPQAVVEMKIQMPEAITRQILAEMKKQMAEDIKRQMLVEMKSQMAEEFKRQMLAETKSQMPEDIKPQARAEMKSQIAEDIRPQGLAEMKSRMAEDIKRQVIAELTGVGGQSLPVAPSVPGASGADPAPAANAATDKTKPRVVRVPYVPESMRQEIREQLKKDVLAQAKDERWGNPGVLPEWLERFKFEGDIRLRSDSFRLGKDNTPAGSSYVSDLNLTRGADLVGANGNYFGVPNVDPQDNFNRTRLRARFGATAKVADSVSAGFRISTGSTSGPTSTNQTMGQGFNKYSVVLDQGYLTFKPVAWLSLTGGRIANPFFSTDLVWADDLNFEGGAANFSQPLTPELTAFATVGYFPLRTDNPLQTTSRDLKGLQTGLDWKMTPTTDLKLAAAIYHYKGIEGQVESVARFTSPLPSDYGTRYEYPAGFRQRGNTLFIVNANTQLETLNPTYWGLASGFNELDLTASLDIARFDPVHVVLTGDYVRNLAFDHNKIAQVTGSQIIDGKNSGYLGKITVGHPTMTRWGDWNASLAYRWLGSDAVLDAFTNSDFGMGGTNNKGYILGGSWGIDKNAWISARWMASHLIDSMAPATASSTIPATKFSVDLLQVDLNAKF